TSTRLPSVSSTTPTARPWGPRVCSSRWSLPLDSRSASGTASPRGPEMAVGGQILHGSRRGNSAWHIVGQTLFFILVAGVVVGTLFPLYWMFVTSARALEEN